MKYTIYNESTNFAFVLDDTTTVFLYGYIVEYHHRNHEDGLRLAKIGHDMMVKDFNETNLYRLAYFLSEIKDIDGFETMDVYEQLHLLKKHLIKEG